MSEEIEPTGQEPDVTRYLESVLQGRIAGTESPDGLPVLEYGAAQLGPEFWADAPWRLGPDQRGIPFTFIIRDGDGDNVKIRLKEITVWETVDDGTPLEEKGPDAWRLVHTFRGEGDGPIGPITEKFWTYRPAPSTSLDPPPVIPLEAFETICETVDGERVPVRGQRLVLKIVFNGTQLRGGARRSLKNRWQPLLVFLASEVLPLRDSPQWYYGDTHYHSSYTNDLKEFGNPVPDTRAAAEGMGLDWLVITDHSVDLKDDNFYWADTTPAPGDRWQALGAEVQNNSDARFRLVRGEEVTVAGKPGAGSDLIHLLVFGDGFEEMIPGAFGSKNLLGSVAASLSGYAKELYESLFGPIYELEEVLTGKNAQGTKNPVLEERSVQAQAGALAFAAHPTLLAQSLGGLWEDEDLAQPINGVEAWNIRMRFHASHEQSPFDHWEKATDWEEGTNKKGIDLWERCLRTRVGWKDPRFVLLGGSDAHGSFNYTVAWWLDWDGIRADDGCMGKVRTLLYLPERSLDSARHAPTIEEITWALGKGSCVVTDGPVLNLSVGFDGQVVAIDGDRPNGNVQAKMGQVMSIEGDGALTVTVQAAPTAASGQASEFGVVNKVKAVYYFQGEDETLSEIKVFEFIVGGRAVLAGDLPSGPGYVRLETVTQNGDDVFRCFTNPIWIKSAGPGKRTLNVRCVGW